MGNQLHPIQFKPATEKECAAMGSLANSLTNHRASVRVSVEAKDPDWLVAEFTMPTETQLSAVDKIDSAIRYYTGDRVDSVIQFPRTEAEIARAKRKAERRKSRNRERRDQQQ